MSDRDLYRFLALTFGLGALVQAVAIRSGVHAGGHGWLALAMWTPAIAALSFGPTRRYVVPALRRKGWRTLGYAFVAGTSVSALQMISLWLTHTGHWNDALFALTPDHSRIAGAHGIGLILGVGEQGFGYFALNLLLSISTGSVFTMFIGGIGEEVGWRGILQPELARRFGPLRGTVVVGLVWAYWHVPVNLAGYNDAAHPVLATFVLFPAFVVSFSFVLAWLTQRSRSVWPAALAHGANNTLNAGLLVVASSWTTDQTTGLAAALLVGSFFGWRLSRDREDARPMEPSGAVPT